MKLKNRKKISIIILSAFILGVVSTSIYFNATSKKEENIIDKAKKISGKAYYTYEISNKKKDILDIANELIENGHEMVASVPSNEENEIAKIKATKENLVTIDISEPMKYKGLDRKVHNLNGELNYNDLVIANVPETMLTSLSEYIYYKAEQNKIDNAKEQITAFLKQQSENCLNDKEETKL